MLRAPYKALGLGGAGEEGRPAGSSAEEGVRGSRKPSTYPAAVFMMPAFADGQTLVSALWGQRCGSQKEHNMGTK